MTGFSIACDELPDRLAAISSSRKQEQSGDESKPIAAKAAAERQFGCGEYQVNTLDRHALSGRQLHEAAECCDHCINVFVVVVE